MARCYAVHPAARLGALRTNRTLRGSSNSRARPCARSRAMPEPEPIEADYEDATGQPADAPPPRPKGGGGVAGVAFHLSNHSSCEEELITGASRDPEPPHACGTIR